MSEGSAGGPAGGRGGAFGGQADLDYAELFAAAPTPYLVLTPDLVIRDANRAYLGATGRQRDELVGLSMFEAFPDNPDDPGNDGVRNLRESMERARDTGQPDAMAVQKYDIPDGRGFVERYWSAINVPILDETGTTVLLLHRTQDVTDFVLERDRGHREREASWQRRMEHAEADLFARARELQELNRRLREASKREREVALTLQRAMLPAAPPAVPGMDVAVRYRPADDALNVGGDWYDVVVLDDGRVALTVGDVVGKGLGAATVMGQLRSALTATTYSVAGPPEALDALDGFALSLPGSVGTTVVQVAHNPATRRLRYSRAGHLPPLLLAPDGSTELLFDAGAPPLGVQLEVVPRPRAEVAFPVGSTVVLYTDGLVERRGRPIDDGLDELRALVARLAGLDVEPLADAIVAELVGEHGLVDDTALVVARSVSR